MREILWGLAGAFFATVGWTLYPIEPAPPVSCPEMIILGPDSIYLDTTQDK